MRKTQPWNGACTFVGLQSRVVLTDPKVDPITASFPTLDPAVRVQGAVEVSFAKTVCTLTVIIPKAQSERCQSREG